VPRAPGARVALPVRMKSPDVLTPKARISLPISCKKRRLRLPVSTRPTREWTPPIKDDHGKR
jgi:hypothetical protein